MRTAGRDPAYDAAMRLGRPRPDSQRALGDLAGAPVELERPSDPTTATTRRTSRSGSPARGGGRRARSRGSSPARGPALDGVGRSRSPGRASSTSRSTTVARERRWRRFSRRGARSAGSAGEPEQIQVELVSANPTGPITVASARNGAYGDAVARLLEFAGHGSSASTTTTTPGRRWTSSARPSRPSAAARSRPRTATAASTSPTSRGRTGDPVPRMLERDRGDARAVPYPFRQLRAAERRGGRDPRGARARSRRTRRTARSGRGRPPTATTRTASSSARTARRPTSRPTPPTSGASSRGVSSG